MKKTPRNLVRVAVSNRRHDCRKPYGSSTKGEGRESWIAKKSRRHVPLLVAVNEPRRNCADVRAGTDEQEDDEQEGLEVEERGLT